VSKQELGIPVIGWRLELSLDGVRPGIHSQSLDHCHLGSIHMALDAEITGMARSTARRNLEGPAGGAGLLAMAAEGKVPLLVRLRDREFGDILPRQAGCLGQRHVTGCAACVGRRQMGSLNPMAVEAVLHHSQPDLHSSSGSGVARLTTHR